jgi:hypothetical protein
MKRDRSNIRRGDYINLADLSLIGAQLRNALNKSPSMPPVTGTPLRAGKIELRSGSRDLRRRQWDLDSSRAGRTRLEPPSQGRSGHHRFGSTDRRSTHRNRRTIWCLVSGRHGNVAVRRETRPLLRVPTAASVGRKRAMRSQQIR